MTYQKINEPDTKNLKHYLKINIMDIDKLNKQFNLTQKQWEKFFEWEKSLPKKYYGADNNGITIYFPQSSIGHIVFAKREQDEEIDLTDWDNF